MILYLKENTNRLAYGLLLSEFRCQCEFEACRSIMVSEKLVSAYTAFRKTVDTFLNIRSGHRCTQHNFDVGGVERSRHLAGEAIDIELKALFDSGLIREEIMKIAKQSGFTFIKFYKNFVHMDVR